MSNAEDFVWEDPPPLQRRVDPLASPWAQVVETLKENPGEWAMVRAGGTHAGSFGATQKRLKALGCEAVQRKVSDTEWRLYARWPERNV